MWKANYLKRFEMCLVESHTVSAGRDRGDHGRVLQPELWEINTWEPFVLPVLSQLQSHQLDTWNPLYYRGTESQTDGQKITDRHKQKWTGKLSFVQFISPACVFHQSSFPFPFFSDSELPQTHTNYGLQVCVVTAPPKPTTLAMFGTFKYIIFYKKYSQCKIRCKAVV